MGFVLQFLHFLIEVTKTKILKRFRVLKRISQMRLTRESEVSECKCGGRTFLLPGCCVTHIFSGGSTVLFLCTVPLLSSHRFCTMIYSGWELPGIWLRENWTWFRTWPMFFFSASIIHVCTRLFHIISYKRKHTMKGFTFELHSRARKALPVFFTESHFQCLHARATLQLIDTEKWQPSVWRS